VDQRAVSLAITSAFSEHLFVRGVSEKHEREFTSLDQASRMAIANVITIGS